MMFEYRLATLQTPGIYECLVQRLESLSPDSVRIWGTLSVEGMLCHLNDAFTRMLREDRFSTSASWAGRTILRPLALHTPLPWPRNTPTVPEVDQLREGTPPSGFHQDRAKVLASLGSFHRTSNWQGSLHPMMGPLSHWEWSRWAWLHTDHHLRQFSA